MEKFIEQSKQQGIECMAFGDLFLADIKEYREAKLAGTGITPLFPIWLKPTGELAREMISSGLRAIVTCVDPKQLPASFAGREFNEEFLSALPEQVDPCGERGEFHTFAFDGPMFSKPVDIEVGEITEREGFIYADVLPASSNLAARANAGV
jgi:diphthamide synthase (EF-2-diphthine--ammonia ligase)